MAKTESTGWRHLLMQVVMWLVLAGTVGLAALVNVQTERRQRSALSEPIFANGVVFRLPAGWQPALADDPRVVAQAVEPNRGRMISVVVDQSPTSDPFDYLALRGLLSPAYLTGQRAQAQQETLHFAGTEGVLVAGARRIGPGENAAVINEVMACTILPSGEAITVILQGDGLYDAADVSLVRLLAGEVEVR